MDDINQGSYKFLFHACSAKTDIVYKSKVYGQNNGVIYEAELNM